MARLRHKFHFQYLFYDTISCHCFLRASWKRKVTINYVCSLNSSGNALQLSLVYVYFDYTVYTLKHGLTSDVVFVIVFIVLVLLLKIRPLKTGSHLITFVTVIQVWRQTKKLYHDHKWLRFVVGSLSSLPWTGSVIYMTLLKRVDDFVQGFIMTL